MSERGRATEEEDAECRRRKSEVAKESLSGPTRDLRGTLLLMQGGSGFISLLNWTELKVW